MTADWLEVVHAVVAAGADAVEVGIPFSDPMIDGPVIQEASVAGSRARDDAAAVIDGVRPARDRRAAGRDDLLQPRLPGRAPADGAGRWPRPGVGAAIVPDLPLDEVGPWAAEADDAGVETVLLVAPSTPDDRVAASANGHRGFVYAVARMGVTGERADARRSAARRRRRCGAPPDRPAGPRRGGRVHPGTGGRDVPGRPTAWSSARRSSAACSTAVAPRPRRPSSASCGRPSTRSAERLDRAPRAGRPSETAVERDE